MLKIVSCRHSYRQRIMTAMALKEPDCVPFADWIEDRVKQNLIKAMGERELDDSEFAGRLGGDWRLS